MLVMAERLEMRSSGTPVDHAIAATKRHFGASVLSATATLAGASIMASATLLAAGVRAPATETRHHCVVRHGYGEHHGHYYHDLPPSDGYWTHQIRPSPRGVIRPLTGPGVPAKPHGTSVAAHLTTPPPETAGHDGPASATAPAKAAAAAEGAPDPSSPAGDATSPDARQHTGPPRHDGPERPRSPRFQAPPSAVPATTGPLGSVLGDLTPWVPPRNGTEEP
jgi:hypothetical protein